MAGVGAAEEGREPVLIGCRVLQARLYASGAGSDCSASGLPRTPCSIRIHGRFQKFLSLRHERLCSYIECARASNETVILVSETFSTTLKDHLKSDPSTDRMRLAYQMLQAVDVLHTSGITHHCLDLDCFYVDPSGRVKLSNHALYDCTGGGVLCTFPIGSPRLVPVDKISQGSLPHTRPIPEEESELVFDGPDYDMWTLGLLLVEMFCGEELWSHLTLKQTFSKIFILANQPSLNVLDSILKENGLQDSFSKIPALIQRIVRDCVVASTTERKSCQQLMELFHRDLIAANRVNACVNLMYKYGKREELVLPKTEFSKLPLEKVNKRTMYRSRPLEEMVHLWKLAGGDLVAELKRNGVMKHTAAVCRLPYMVSNDGSLIGNETSRLVRLSTNRVVLNMSLLEDKLSEVETSAFYPLLVKTPTKARISDPQRQYENMQLVGKNIKEVDLQYQLRRMVLFTRLLRGLPSTLQLLLKESRCDIPPLMRGLTWAAALGVDHNVSDCLDSIDFDQTLPCDKQIEVDIPRCHQYHTLLSSPTAHDVLRRVIRAWVITNPDLVYWQGLDSLAAPFISLHFNDPPLAFSSLTNFINKYSYKFFLSDNSAVIQEYLAVLNQLVAFHDPHLSNHLQQQSFTPDLYAMPWFLTMFAHTFPIGKAYHLWDALILRGPEFPLFIGVAILRALRDMLLSTDFDGCILLFSDIPEMDIDWITRLACNMHVITPLSCSHRKWTNPVEAAKQASHTEPSDLTRPATLDKQMHISEYSLTQRRQERCPCISGFDVLSITGLVKRNVSDRNFQCGKYILFDVRSKTEFERGHLPNSVNISVSDIVSPEGDIKNIVQSFMISEQRKLVIVLGSSHRFQDATHFAETLLQICAFPRICVLHGGMEIFSQTEFLIVG